MACGPGRFSRDFPFLSLTKGHKTDIKGFALCMAG